MLDHLDKALSFEFCSVYKEYEFLLSVLRQNLDSHVTDISPEQITISVSAGLSTIYDKRRISTLITQDDRASVLRNKWPIVMPNDDNTQTVLCVRFNTGSFVYIRFIKMENK